jgi:alpha-glucosidase
MLDGPGAAPAFDRAGRDPHRHPMQWAPDPAGGFTTGEPWLTSVDPERRNVRDQREDPTSLLSLYRRLIAFRRTLPPEFELLDSPPGVLAYRRGRHEIALKTAGEPRWSIHPGMD